MDPAFLRRFTCGRWEPTEQEMHGFLDSLLAASSEIRSKSTIAFLVALAARPLTHAAMVNVISYVRKVSPRTTFAGVSSAVNIVGTGGGPSTFNISTTAAFVASAAGAAVVKSGSRAYSSTSGAMDVLRALGVTLPTDAAGVARMLARTGLSFVSEAHSSPVLRRLVTSVLPLSFRDVGGFINTIGPFLCPYEVSGQVLGVAHRECFEPFVNAAMQLESARTMIVQADCGMDELCSVATNRAIWLDSRGSRAISVDCAGFAHGTVTDLSGSDPVSNAGIMRALLSNELLGPKRDTVVLNAAAVLVVAGVVPTIADGVWLASRAITSGAALAKLEQVTRWNELPDAEKTSSVRASSEGMAV